MSQVGRLVVELAASTAAFQADLGKSVRIAESNSQRIGRTIVPAIVPRVILWRT